MLSLTRKTGYGVIAMVYLARLGRDELLSAREIAEQSGASRSLLTNVLKALAAAGYIESVRGAQGGYRLVRRPEQINLAQLIADLEGPVQLAECVVGRDVDDPCNMLDSCPIVGPVRRIQDKLNRLLAATTLAELMEEPTAA